ncbi:MAG: permease [Firmicutes bacterium]|nr:permease [Bacillota bacterium]
MKKYKPYLLLILVVIADIIVLFMNRDLGIRVAVNTGSHILQMLAVLPPIFILIGLLDVWVPREQFMRYMGEESKMIGVALSVLLGAAAAGPLYAAFPLAAIMIQKGVKFSNILISLGAWSTMKIPMFLFEITSLGSSFATTRWLVSLVGIIVMSVIINRLISDDDKQEIFARHKAG